MDENKLTLVLPISLHDSYKLTQRAGLMELGQFIELARERQM